MPRARRSSSAASARTTSRRRDAWAPLLGALGACAWLACRDRDPAPAPAPAGSAAASNTSTEGRVPVVEALNLTEVARALWPGHKQVTYAAVPAPELAALVGVAEALWRGVAGDDPRVAALAAQAGDAGYELRRWRVGAREAWVLRERPDRQRGAGTYLFRVDVDASVAAAVLQAPHAYFDKQTGPIAADVFFAADAPPQLRALFTSSVHRYQVRPGVRTKRAHSPADVCHNPAHAFNDVTAAVLASGARGIVQLHGFADRTDAGPDPDRDPDPDSDDEDALDDVDAEPTTPLLAVVSAGGRQRPAAAARSVAAALQRAFGAGVRTYPDQTKQLGATTNAQAARVDAVPGAQFVHVELSASLRNRLIDDAASARALRQAIAHAVTRLPTP